MAGLKTGAPTPEALTLHGQSRALEISFSDGQTFRIPFELMRVYSPSAEVQGHGPGQETLQLNKQNVEIEKLNPMGNYAISIHFSDGHTTGIYSWSYLHHLCIDKDELWLDYSNRVTNSSKNNYHKVEI